VSETAECVLEQHGKPTGKQHWSVKAKNTSSSSGWSANNDKMKFSDVQKCSDSESATSPSDSSILWVDHHKPTNLREIIGQQGDKSSARKLYVWLSNWRDNFWKKPVCEFDSATLDNASPHRANGLYQTVG